MKRRAECLYRQQSGRTYGSRRSQAIATPIEDIEEYESSGEESGLAHAEVFNCWVRQRRAHGRGEFRGQLKQMN